MVLVLCEFCKKGFYTKPSWVRYGRKYCSIKCQRLGSRKGKNVNCAWCGKEVYRPLKNIKRTKSGKLFCSRLCAIAWIASEHQTEKHPNWKTGEKSYRYILERAERPKECEYCHNRDEIILAVHHVDRNRKNNASDNLSWLCHNCHFLVHHYVHEKKRWLKVRKV